MSPACDGTGVLAGGAVRAVMEAAGVQNCLAKQQGTREIWEVWRSEGWKDGRFCNVTLAAAQLYH